MRVVFLQAAETAAPAAAGPTIELDPVSLILNASGPVMVVVWMLIVAAVLVWFIAVLKILQLRRWRTAQQRFEADAVKVLTRYLERAPRDAPAHRLAAEAHDRLGNTAASHAALAESLARERDRWPIIAGAWA